MTIRTLVLSAPLLLLPLAVQAEPVWWGQAELEVGQTTFSNLEGNSETDIDPGNRNNNSYRLNGKLGAAFGAFGLQLDANASADDGIAGEYTSYAGGRYAALHATWQFAPTAALGLVYGSGRSEAENEGDTATLNFAALEGSYDFGTVLVTASAGRFDAEDVGTTDAFHNGSYISVGGLSEIWGGVIEGNLGYFKGKQDSGAEYDMDGYTYEVKYSRQINEMPLAWSAGLEGGQFSNGNSGDNGSFDTMRVTLGLTTWFGGGSLAETKRRGIFDTPDFSRIVQAGYNVD